MKRCDECRTMKVLASIGVEDIPLMVQCDKDDKRKGGASFCDKDHRKN